jgi:hypothetical protein
MENLESLLTATEEEREEKNENSVLGPEVGIEE